MKSVSIFSKVIMSLVMTLSLSVATFAQSNDRSFIRDAISKYGSCKNVAITKYNGDVMLYGTNGWAADGCPRSLTDALHDLNAKNETITDVQLTENGSWLILYGYNGFRWDGIPYSLERVLRECNDNREVVTSVSFNDDNDWIVISTEYIRASDSDLQDWIAEKIDDYGQVWATCLTDDAAVVVYEGGYRFLGNVPQKLKDRLTSTSINVYRVKIAGTAWFFSDNKSRYDYNM